MVTVRRAVRVLLIDPADRVLLMQFQVDDTDRCFWITVGGGIEDGESLEEAARREVFEEVGLLDFQLGPVVWIRREVFLWVGEEIDQSETIFMARVPAFEPSSASHTEVELAYVRDTRWWSLEELERTEEVFYPTQLAHHFRALLSEGPPPS